VWSRDGVKSTGLIRPVSSLPTLEQLSIKNCPDVSDAVLVAIATHLPALDTSSLTVSLGYGSAGPAALVRSFCRGGETPDFSPTVAPQVWQDRVPVLSQCEALLVSDTLNQVGYW
jgi:hypothetical protein